MKRLLGWGIVFLVAVGVAVAIWVTVQRGRGVVASVNLPGGTSLRCIAITHGTNHVASRQSLLLLRLPGPFRRLVSRLLPNLGAETKWTTGEPRIVVWYEIVTPPGTALSPAAQIAISMADEEGFEAGERSMPLVTMPTVMRVEFSSYPTRSRMLELPVHGSIDGGMTWSSIGRLRLPNPAFSLRPPLVASPLPVSATNGLLVATVSGVRGGFGNSSFSKALPNGKVVTGSYLRRPGENSRTALRFQIQDLEAGTNTWTVSRLRFTDANGNTFTPQGMSWLEATSQVDFEPGPWPGEVWQMELWARRTSAARFQPEELIVFKDLALPPVGTATNLSTIQTVGPTSVSLVSLHHAQPSASRNWSSRSLSNLKLRLEAFPTDTHFTFVRAVDDQGRDVPSPSFSWSGKSVPGTGPEDVDATLGFQIAADARSLSVTVAFQRMTRFVFNVQADMATTNNSPESVPEN